MDVKLNFVTKFGKDQYFSFYWEKSTSLGRTGARGKGWMTEECSDGEALFFSQKLFRYGRNLASSWRNEWRFCSPQHFTSKHFLSVKRRHSRKSSLVHFDFSTFSKNWRYIGARQTIFPKLGAQEANHIIPYMSPKFGWLWIPTSQDIKEQIWPPVFPHPVHWC